jgi:hypothetical protein
MSTERLCATCRWHEEPWRDEDEAPGRWVFCLNEEALGRMECRGCSLFARDFGCRFWAASDG